MTREQVEKHGEVIKWFVDNPDKGVYELTSIGWKLTYEPNFYPADKYVQNDRYAEFRKALVDGKTIQVNDFGEWKDLKVNIIEEIQCRSIEDYRIKPDEPEIKIGDWVKDISPENSGIHQITTEAQLEQAKSDSAYELWEPKDGELCVFWDDNDGERFDYWVINTLYRACKDKYYQDANGNKWDNVAPLEFVETLKDRR